MKDNNQLMDVSPFFIISEWHQIAKQEINETTQSRGMTSVGRPNSKDAPSTSLP